MINNNSLESSENILYNNKCTQYAKFITEYFIEGFLEEDTEIIEEGIRNGLYNLVDKINQLQFRSSYSIKLKMEKIEENDYLNLNKSPNKLLTIDLNELYDERLVIIVSNSETNEKYEIPVPICYTNKNFFYQCSKHHGEPYIAHFIGQGLGLLEAVIDKDYKMSTIIGIIVSDMGKNLTNLVDKKSTPESRQANNHENYGRYVLDYMFIEKTKDFYLLETIIQCDELTTINNILKNMTFKIKGRNKELYHISKLMIEYHMLSHGVNDNKLPKETFILNLEKSVNKVFENENKQIITTIIKEIMFKIFEPCDSGAKINIPYNFKVIEKCIKKIKR